MNSLVKLLCEKISTFTNLKMGSLRNFHARGIDPFEKTEAEIKKEHYPFCVVSRGLQHSFALMLRFLPGPIMRFLL